jgi:threonine dehydratase
MITLKDVQDSYTRIAPYIRRTDSVKNYSLSQQLGTNLYLKYELFQKTSSFKPRAAFSKLLRLNKEERSRGAVAVSGGNFAQGVAYAGRTLGIGTKIIMPAYTPKNYIEATQSYGGQIEIVPDVPSAFDLAEQFRQRGWVFLHPYDDPDVMSGNGTIGLEVLEQVPAVTDVIISVGGGGLISDITIALKSLKPQIRIWTVETEGAATLGSALQEGQVVRIQPASLAKTLGATYVAADALMIAQQHIWQHILVSDREAYEAQRFLFERAKILIELAASCTLAAAYKIQEHFSNENHVVLILCGGNVSLKDLIEYRNKFE